MAVDGRHLPIAAAVLGLRPAGTLQPLPSAGAVSNAMLLAAHPFRVQVPELRQGQWTLERLRAALPEACTATAFLLDEDDAPVVRYRAPNSGANRRDEVRCERVLDRMAGAARRWGYAVVGLEALEEEHSIASRRTAYHTT